MPTKKPAKKKASKKSTALVRQKPSAVLRQAKQKLAERPPTVEDLMSQAIARGDVAVMEKLFDMRRVMKAETANEKYNAELAAFQKECPPIQKKKAVTAKKQGSTTGEKYTKYHYAPLEDILKVAGPFLVDRGFSWDWDSEFKAEAEGRGMLISCTLRHELGHSETRRAFAPIDPDAVNISRMNVAQQYNSSISYAKRTAFCNVTGIVPVGDDKDGRTQQEQRNQGGGKDHRSPVTQPRERTGGQQASTSDKPLPPGERPQIEPVSESGNGIDSATAGGFTKAMKRAFSGYGDQAGEVAWVEFRKRFPKIERLSQVPDTPEAKKLILNWITDPEKN